ncbi:MAG: hypothetical protein NVS3B1_29500 [Marmoricola sp.]
MTVLRALAAGAALAVSVGTGVVLSANRPPEPVAAAADTPGQPGVVLPDQTFTPGVVDQTVSQATICTTSTRGRRDVTTATKDAVFAEYGITSHAPHQYEVDHLIPLELGGSNDIHNLWPQPANPPPGFHEKDALENRLHTLVCSGALPLATAQNSIAHDWYAAYLLYAR